MNMIKRFLFSANRLDTGEEIHGDLLHRDYGGGDISPVIVVHNAKGTVGRSDDHKIDYDTVKFIVNVENGNTLLDELESGHWCEFIKQIQGAKFK